jgi:hypothetical protein
MKSLASQGVIVFKLLAEKLLSYLFSIVYILFTDRN